MDLPIKRRCFAKTKAALNVYYDSLPARQQAWKSVTSNEQVHAANTADRKALEALQDAFHEDTKDINSLAHCRLVTAQDIAKMVDYQPELAAA
ncbi:hypothetical protein [Herbaspirillum huttiense]|uniref:Uncharacterized protein n=1 Tax=Herbaspirillum huttiense subsp. lycopersici TaxID=3074428 RepID=A0ABU2EFZ4_9BURK|nr:hypothetical protein [Herbaspirillum huttiense]MDR9847069.1 hypothetical protein [Herbaspirillum huttiense SE1]